jgi:hypothetical protein
VWRRLRSLPIADRRKRGEEHPEAKPVHGHAPPVRFPLELVQVDHTPMALILVDPLDREPIGRPWLTVAIDVQSRWFAKPYAPPWSGCVRTASATPRKLQMFGDEGADCEPTLRPSEPVSMIEPFHQFWGKARPHEGASASWHPVACHALDVAAVAEKLLAADPHRADAVLRVCGWPLADFHRVVVFLVALHDLGKFSRPFQAKAQEHWPPVLGGFALVPGPRHDAVGLGLLEDDAVLDILDGVLPGWYV